MTQKAEILNSITQEVDIEFLKDTIYEEMKTYFDYSFKPRPNIE